MGRVLYCQVERNNRTEGRARARLSFPQLVGATCQWPLECEIRTKFFLLTRLKKFKAWFGFYLLLCSCPDALSVFQPQAYVLTPF